MRTEPVVPIQPQEVRYLEANGGCRGELELQRYAMEAAGARFAESMRRLWEFIRMLDERRSDDLPR